MYSIVVCPETSDIKSYFYTETIDLMSSTVEMCRGSLTCDLDVVIRNLLYETTFRFLRIDRLCIDHDGDDGKWYQLPIVYKVSRSASQAVVWLAPDEIDSNDASIIFKWL